MTHAQQTDGRCGRAAEWQHLWCLARKLHPFLGFLKGVTKDSQTAGGEELEIIGNAISKPKGSWDQQGKGWLEISEGVVAAGGQSSERGKTEAVQIKEDDSKIMRRGFHCTVLTGLDKCTHFLSLTSFRCVTSHGSVLTFGSQGSQSITKPCSGWTGLKLTDKSKLSIKPVN
ncbi:Mucin-2 [Manis pentadactyla]|nr:Mucin-2 [Manis pentadactyla]